MIDVKETLGNAEEKMEMGVMYLEEQLARVRAGRANVAILDGVKVESYGSMVPLNQVANVSVPDPRTIAIRPWDKKQIRAIEKAIMDSDVGITPYYTGETMRLAQNDILIMEGIHGLNDKLTPKVKNEFKFKIYLSALTQLNIDDHTRIPSSDNRLIRRIVRDSRFRGKSAADTIGMWQSVQKGELLNIFFT